MVLGPDGNCYIRPVECFPRICLKRNKHLPALTQMCTNGFLPMCHLSRALGTNVCSSFTICVGAVTVATHMQKGLGSNPGIALFLSSVGSCAQVSVERY